VSTAMKRFVQSVDLNQGRVPLLFDAGL